MFGFGKKKEATTEQDIEKELKDAEAKMPRGMKELAERMMAGQFSMNDMLAQLKQMKKMGGVTGGVMKLVPGMKDAVNAMREKLADGSVDRQIKIMESMTDAERAAPEKIFANAKQRIADEAGATVREVEQVIKRYEEMARQMKMINNMGGMQAVMEKMKNMPGAPGMPPMPNKA